jgi:hypothetical protein
LAGKISALPLNSLNNNSNGDLNSYDKDTHVITYGGDWQFYGWNWDGIDNGDVRALDLSKYTSLMVNYDASGLPEFSENTDPTKIQVQVEYTEGAPDMVEGRNFWGQVIVPLDPVRSNHVKVIYVKSQKPGTLKLLGVTLFGGTPATPDELLPIDQTGDLNSGYESSYDGETHTITFDGAWKGRGWWFGTAPGKDLTDYKYAVVEFEPVDFQVQLLAEYNGDPKPANNTAIVNAGAKRVVLELNEEAKGDVQQIYLQSSAAGQVTLIKAYLTNTDPRQPDLIVTDITWAPASPAPGDKVLFSAKIKNIGDGATTNIKHGVAFSVGTAVVSWSDNYKTAMAPGDEVTVTATGGPSVPEWTVGKNPFYSITAHVNDNPNDGIKNESNTDNNKLVKELKVTGTIDLKIRSIASSPSKPKAGDQVTFSALIENTGTLNSPAGVVHRLTFSIDGVQVSENDTYVTAILSGNADGSRISATTKWTATTADFTVVAEVNGAVAGEHPIEESDYTNNTLSAIYGAGSSINVISATNGGVYVENGNVKLAGYSNSASIVVYNLMGQRVPDTNLTAGSYVVRVQDNGQAAIHKVLVK